MTETTGKSTLSESQSAFAERMGLNKSFVTRLKQAGRLVLTQTGQVDVEASIARIDATRGTRYDVEYRNAQSRNPQLFPDVATAPTRFSAPDNADRDSAPVSALDLDEIGRRTRHAQMLEREAVARMREREDLELAGDLVRRQAVSHALTTAVGVILNAAETLPDRVTPLLIDVSDSARIRALLRDEIETLLATVSSQLTSVAN
jgi:hypothetical protein